MQQAPTESALQISSQLTSLLRQNYERLHQITVNKPCKALVEETVGSYRDNLDIIQNRYEDGLASALDLRLTQASLTSSRAKFEHEREEQEAKRALEVLLGHYPCRIQLRKDITEGCIPYPTRSAFRTNFPSTNIRAAQKRLLAAGFAPMKRGKLFTDSLTGTNGTASQNLRDLNDASFSAWNLVGNLTQPHRWRTHKSPTKVYICVKDESTADYKNIV